MKIHLNLQYKLIVFYVKILIIHKKKINNWISYNIIRIKNFDLHVLDSYINTNLTHQRTFINEGPK